MNRGHLRAICPACLAAMIAGAAVVAGPAGAGQTQHKAPPKKPRPNPNPTPTPAPPAPPSPADPPRITTQPIADYGEMAHWRGDGNTVDDTGKNNGALTGGATYSPAMNGRGFRFSGRDDSVRVQDSFTLRLTGSMTITGWINVDQFSTPDEDKGFIIFRGDDRPGLDPYGLWVGSDQRITFHVESMTDSAEISAPIPGRRFMMVTATLDNSTGEMRIFENTILVARRTTAVRPLADLDPTQHPGIGIGNANAVPDGGYRYPFHGVINDLRVFNRVLSPGEIHSLYAECLTVPSPIQRHEGDN